MTVRINMEEGLTLTKAVSVKINGYSEEGKKLAITLDGKINTTVTVIEGTPDEVNNLSKMMSITLQPNGEFSVKISEESTGVAKPTRSGSAVRPLMTIR